MQCQNNLATKSSSRVIVLCVWQSVNKKEDKRRSLGWER